MPMISDNLPDSKGTGWMISQVLIDFEFSRLLGDSTQI